MLPQGPLKKNGIKKKKTQVFLKTSVIKVFLKGWSDFGGGELRKEEWFYKNWNLFLFSIFHLGLLKKLCVLFLYPPPS